MKLKRVVKHGIFCVEGSWNIDFRDKSTIRPVLDLLSLREDVENIYHTAMTREELFFLSKRWVQKRYNKYPILYIAAHGTRDGLCLFPYKNIQLDDLAEVLAGKCKNRVVFMGSCFIFSSKPKVLKNFLQRTQALMIAGYQVSVDWTPATAFELLVLSTLQKHKLEGRALRFLTQKLDILSAKFPELEFRYLTKDDVR